MSKKKKYLVSIAALAVLIAVQIYFLVTYDYFKAEGGFKIEYRIDPADITKKHVRASLDYDYVMEDAIREYDQNGGDFLTVLAASNQKRLKKPLVQLFGYKEIVELSLDSDDDEVIDFLRNELDQNLEITASFFKNWMKRAIKRKTNVWVDSDKLKMTIEVLGQADSLRSEDFQLPQVNLSFYECITLYEFINYWNAASGLTKPEIDTLTEIEWKLTDANKVSIDSRQTLANTVQWSMNGLGVVRDKDKEFVANMLHVDSIADVFPIEYRFAWSNHPENGVPGKMWSLYVIRVPENGAAISNDDIHSAKFIFDEVNAQKALEIRMTQEGTDKWLIMTEENVGRPIAICVNGAVFSAPNVLSPIYDGVAQLTGSDPEHLKDIETVLNYRSLEIYPTFSKEAFVKASPPLLNALIQKILLTLSIILVLFLGVQYFRSSRAI